MYGFGATGSLPYATLPVGGATTTVEPGVASITYTGYAPTVTPATTFVLPGVGALTYTGFAPTISTPSGIVAESWRFNYLQAQTPAAYAVMFRTLNNLLRNLRRYGLTADEGVYRLTSSGIQLQELSAEPSAPPAGEVIIFAIDDGSGYTDVKTLFATGDSQLVSAEYVGGFDLGFSVGFG